MRLYSLISTLQQAKTGRQCLKFMSAGIKQELKLLFWTWGVNQILCGVNMSQYESILMCMYLNTVILRSRATSKFVFYPSIFSAIIKRNIFGT